jgi:AcrR family transcriptional regulator
MSRTPDPTAKISLLTAAEAVFAEKGLASAKVEDITRRAGLSKGAFYLHFESKEQAFEQVAESFLARCSAYFTAPADEVPRTTNGLLEFWHERDVGIYEFLWKNRPTVAIVLGCQQQHQYLLESFHRQIDATSAAWIKLYKERGLFRNDCDSAIVSTLVCGAYSELSRRVLSSAKKPPMADWLLETRRVFVRGLGTPQLIEALEHLEGTARLVRRSETPGHAGPVAHASKGARAR